LLPWHSILPPKCAPRGAGDAKMNAGEEDRSEDQKKH